MMRTLLVPYSQVIIQIVSRTRLGVRSLFNFQLLSLFRRDETFRAFFDSKDPVYGIRTSSGNNSRG